MAITIALDHLSAGWGTTDSPRKSG